MTQTVVSVTGEERGAYSKSQSIFYIVFPLIFFFKPLLKVTQFLITFILGLVCFETKTYSVTL